MHVFANSRSIFFSSFFLSMICCCCCSCSVFACDVHVALEAQIAEATTTKAKQCETHTPEKWLERRESVRIRKDGIEARWHIACKRDNKYAPYRNACKMKKANVCMHWNMKCDTTCLNWCHKYVRVYECVIECWRESHMQLQTASQCFCRFILAFLLLLFFFLSLSLTCTAPMLNYRTHATIHTFLYHYYYTYILCGVQFCAEQKKNMWTRASAMVDMYVLKRETNDRTASEWPSKTHSVQSILRTYWYRISTGDLMDDNPHKVHIYM